MLEIDNCPNVIAGVTLLKFTIQFAGIEKKNLFLLFILKEVHDKKIESISNNRYDQGKTGIKLIANATVQKNNNNIIETP